MQPQLIDSSGRAVVLGKSLGRGGEGEVFELPEQPGLVAKIYHAQPDQSRRLKIESMVRRASPELTRIAAWPQQLLISPHDRELHGIVMPRVVRAKPIFELYSLAQRKTHFPKADYRFLVRAARNCAAAFDTVHRAGIVIGDVNQGNVLVNDQALVTFIDCDSFQIADEAGRVFRCEVGVAHYTPPELQSVNLGTVTRTVDHDGFGLATLIFHLLFLGRHPFAGKFLGTGDMPLETAIKEYRFAFAKGGASRLEPPPHSLTLSDITPRLARLFEVSFGRTTKRPSANEWCDALVELESGLAGCPVDPGHHYASTLSKCPFCRIADAGGPNFFITVTVQALLGSATKVNVDDLWGQIQRLPTPRQAVLASTVPRLARPKVRKANVGASERRTLIRFLKVTAICFAAMVPVSLTNPVVVLWMAAAVGFGLWWRVEVRNDPVSILYREYRGKLGLAKAQLQSAVRRFEQQRSEADRRFAERKRSIEGTYTQIKALPKGKAAELTKMQQSLRDRQLYNYLDSHLIENAQIPGIAAARADILQSFGIESAADINVNTLSMVPGFGDVLIGRLLAWRQYLESKFVFNATGGLPKKDLDDLELRYAKLQIQGDRVMKQGLEELKQLTATVTRVTEGIQTEINSLAAAVVEAESQLASLS